MAEPAGPGVSEFYAGKNVFLTGATGFLGKVFIWKLLHSCPGLEGVYCLIRPKKGQDGQERLQALIKSQCFDDLLTEKPELAKKVHAVAGDMLEPQLGISEDDRSMLKERINVIIHSAATIKFNEHLRLATTMNLVGVRQMVELARSMDHLEAFVHISTAYSNCHLKTIEEKVYTPKIPPQKIIDAMEWLDDTSIEHLQPSLLGAMPNTYTLTKMLAEQLLREEAADLPVAIIRPSIVTCALREPLPGWIDHVYGPSGLSIAYGKGIMRSLRGDPKAVADMVPLDLVVNSTLTIAWQTAKLARKDRPTLNGSGTQTPNSQMVIYHVNSGTENPVTWGRIEKVMHAHYYKFPLESCFRPPNKWLLTESNLVHYFSVLLTHYLPAHIVDAYSWAVGKKLRLVRVYNGLHAAMDSMEFFLRGTWHIANGNMNQMRAGMSEEDQKVFYSDVKDFNWETYVSTFCNAGKRFVLKEDMAKLPVAKRSLRRLRVLYTLWNMFLVLLLLKVILGRNSLARRLLSRSLKMLFQLLSSLKR